jgi:hypothetical protein
MFTHISFFKISLLTILVGRELNDALIKFFYFSSR